MTRDGRVKSGCNTSVLQRSTRATGKHKESKKVMMGDFNRFTDDKDLQELLTKYDLQDIFNLMYPYMEELPTHQRGSKRIDYFLISMDLIPNIKRMGPFGMDIKVDHRGIFLDLCIHMIQDTPLPPIRNINYTQSQRVESTEHTCAKGYKNNKLYID